MDTNENSNENQGLTASEIAEKEEKRKALLKRYHKLDEEQNEVMAELHLLGCTNDLEDLGVGIPEKPIIFNQKMHSNDSADFDIKNKDICKFLVRLKVEDMYSFSDGKKVEREIEAIKGNVNIEKAFFNRYNKNLYLLTNDEDSYNKLSSEWPTNAFNKGVTLVQEVKKQPKYFVAINGMDLNLDIDKNDDYKVACDKYGIVNSKRIIKKETNTALAIVKAELKDKLCYDNIIKFKFKMGSFSFRVSPWKYDELQPLQCYKCLKFGHNQTKCTSSQKCLLCAGEHSFKECQFKDEKSKDNLKCINCNGRHAACSKECPNNKAASEAKQQDILKRTTSHVNPNRKYNSLFNSNQPSNSTDQSYLKQNTQQTTNSLCNNTIILQFIQLLTQ
jgi:hypothetical protein